MNYDSIRTFNVQLSKSKSIQALTENEQAIFHDAGKIGLVSDSFYFIHNYNTGDNNVFSMINNEKVNKETTERVILKYLSHFI